MKLSVPRLNEILGILGLSSFALAQPLFDLLARNVEFFVAHRSGRLDIILLIFGVCLLPTILIATVETLAGFVGRKCQQGLHAIVIVVLTAAILLPAAEEGRWSIRQDVTGRGDPPGHCFFIGLLPVPKTAALYDLSFARSGRLPPCFPIPHSCLQACFTKDVASVATTKVGAPASIVMVIFDEFPLASLLDETRQIDPVRYPNFFALSKAATWYRNATTVNEGTLNAVPAILDARYPRPGLRLVPNAKDHPHSLFTLLGGSYQFNVVETNTKLCPEQFCGEDEPRRTSLWRRIRRLFRDVGILYLYVLLNADLTQGLPDITQSWKDFGLGRQTPSQDDEPWAEYHNQVDWRDRPGQFRQFVESIQPSSKPTLHFLHILLPHAPWEYLPSGKKYTFDVKIRGVMGTNDKGVDPNQWVGNQWAVVQAYQRHLLQVGLVDRLLGDLLDRLKTAGLFDPALIVITADHGTSFRLNDSRRRPSATNYPDIMAIPLFVKAPHQEKGSIDDRNVETVDILPTIADILQISMPWKVEGRSAMNQSLPEKIQKMVISEDGRKLVLDPRLDAKYETVIQKIRLFGSGSNPDGLFQIGTHRALIGRRADEIMDAGNISLQCQIDDEGSLSNVDFSGPILLTHLTGRIHNPRQGNDEPIDLAVAVNGIVRAVTETYKVSGEERFSVVLPDSAFRGGHNDVDIFQVADRNGQPVLAAVKRVNRDEYRWGTVISFAINGNARLYQAEGWAAPETYYSWNDGNRARLVLPTSLPKSHVTLKARLSAFLVPGRIEKQTLRILVNQRLAGEWVVTSPGFHYRALTIPNQFFANPKETVITFEMPDAVTPVSAGIGTDMRSLSMAITSLVLTQ